MRNQYIFSRLFVMLTLFLSFSCNNEDITKITAIKLETIGGSELLINQEFKFVVKGNNSDIITDQVVLKIDDMIIEDAKFSSEVPGDFHVQAFYQDFASEVLEVKAIYPSGFVKNVLIEDYTGTWCVNCPKMVYAIDQAKEQSDKIVSVGIHASDPMEMDGYELLKSEFGISGYPTGMLNRINLWDEPDINVQTPIELTGYGADLGLSIDSSISGDTVEATIQVGFEIDISLPLKLVVCLTENELHYDQYNSTDYFGGDFLLENFEHNDVLRSFFTDFLGETIASEDATADTIYEYSFTQTIPTTVEDATNLHIIAFVTNATTNEVINVREVKIGEEQELQEL